MDSTLNIVGTAPDEVIDQYLGHRFDLLGSGWTTVCYGMVCEGFEGHVYLPGQRPGFDSTRKLAMSSRNPNAREANRLRSQIDEAYRPIDWQLDFKSGYRWSELSWYKDIRMSNMPGADIKVPWELARAQHLPQMAIAYSGPSRHVAQSYLPREFRNQVLDFIAANPPRYGVNWMCTMDVAIRAANWLLAYDIFENAGAEFDDEFNRAFHRSVYEHGLHVANNLEWFDGVRANHYLANIAGLSFISAWLEGTRETTTWYAFCVQELPIEIQYQFHADGTNFEGSTAYHRFATEMAVYASAVLLGAFGRKRSADGGANPAPIARGTWLKADRGQFSALSGTDQRPSLFDASLFETLLRSACFIRDVTKPGGHFPQIGDHDSGRFLKPFPIYRKSAERAASSIVTCSDSSWLEAPWIEDHLDARHAIAAVSGLLDRPDLSKALPHELASETSLVQALRNSAGADFPIAFPGEVSIPPCASGRAIARTTSALVRDSPSEQVIQRFPLPTDWESRGVLKMAYPDFGVYVLRTDELYLAFRCHSSPVAAPSAHLHFDQLSLELEVAGQSIWEDPGSYVYTASPEKRLLYRSAKAHNTPCEGGAETLVSYDDLFRLDKIPKAEILRFEDRLIVGIAAIGFKKWQRSVFLGRSELVVEDIAFGEARLNRPMHNLPTSLGYGIISA